MKAAIRHGGFTLRIVDSTRPCVCTVTVSRPWWLLFVKRVNVSIVQS